ncbi:MAG: M14 family metallocarboxypeptidase [Xanthomonadales bacterium]|nr:M14 family metallocarboxypeptidase [Xanthomonadales bacterium]
MNQSPSAIGTPGTPWGAAEIATWRGQHARALRSYPDEVVTAIQALADRFEVVEYGELEHAPDRFTLFALRSRAWRNDLPVMLITGGVHGYETSGVQGALQFARDHGDDYQGRANLLIAPCVSPWGYERHQRWNADAIDPNRSFGEPPACAEAAALMRLVAPLASQVLMHIDLHETTDTDESEFRPALAARDGTPFEPGSIPDGFYLVDDADNLQPAFQAAIIEAVSAVTHIAPADEHGQLIGSAMLAPGVIAYPCRPLGLCAGMTNARFRTTTEVYPDSPRTTPEQCNQAQVVAVRAAIEHALANPANASAKQT